MTARKLIAFALTFMLGVGLGAGSTLAVTQQVEDQPVAVGGYEVVRDDLGDLELRVWVTTGTHPVFTVWRVEEKADRVEVAVREQSRDDSDRTMEAVISHFSWSLHAPLGSRRVVDAATGKDVPPAAHALPVTSPGHLAGW